jgi:DNA-binding GntR family transcriptional regulator
VVDVDPGQDFSTGRGSRRTAAGRLPRRNLSVEVVNHVRRLIFNGSLKAGQRIPQDAIAEELGVSRLPVREALIALEGEGLVASEPHRGSFVVPIHAEDIADHYRVYGMAQGLAARRAAKRVTGPTLQRLEQLHDQMGKSEDPDVLHDLNWEFHSLINQTGGSARLRSILHQLSRNLPREVYEAAPGADAKANADHQEFLEALRTGDGDRADQVSRRHVQAEADHVIAKLMGDGVLTGDLD